MMSSIVEKAEVVRLRKAVEEHERAARFHEAEATRIHCAYCAAKVRLQRALQAEARAAREATAPG